VLLGGAGVGDVFAGENVAEALDGHFRQLADLLFPAQFPGGI
jgi:hypothetical protein